MKKYFRKRIYFSIVPIKTVYSILKKYKYLKKFNFKICLTIVLCSKGKAFDNLKKYFFKGPLIF